MISLSPGHASGNSPACWMVADALPSIARGPAYCRLACSFDDVHDGVATGWGTPATTDHNHSCCKWRVRGVSFALCCYVNAQLQWVTCVRGVGCIIQQRKHLCKLVQLCFCVQWKLSVFCRWRGAFLAALRRNLRLKVF